MTFRRTYQYIAFLLSVSFTTAASQASCGGIRTGTAIITSPGFPNRYPDNATCSWSLTAAPNRTVVVQFVNISLQADADFVSVYVDGQLIVRYTGSTLPPPLTLTSTAQVVFTSDSSVSSTGFRLVFMSRLLTCGGLVKDSGVVSSPNYPDALYPNYANCYWTVVTAPDSRINLRVMAFALEGQNKDTLSIYDGGQNLLGTFSGRLETPFNITVGSVAILEFRSNMIVQDSGFMILVSH